MAKLIRRKAATAAAYQSIHDFFDCYFLCNAVEYLEDLIEAAAGRTVWKKDTPANLLYFTKQLEALCNAAFAICNTKEGKDIAAIPIPQKMDTSKIDQRSNYMRAKSHLMPWECYPWHLEWNEYYTPYIPIKKFVDTMSKISWYRILYDILEYAFSNGSISDTCSFYKLLIVRKRLLALIEAFHLVEVRFISKEEIKKPAAQKSPSATLYNCPQPACCQ